MSDNIIAFIKSLTWSGSAFLGLLWKGWCGGLLAISAAYGCTVLFNAIILDHAPVNLKKKYGATWALVTGASRGIGRAIVEKCAEQELNVVLVAEDDNDLEKAYQECKSSYPELIFIKIGVDLGEPSFMEKIVEATKNITIQLVFNNAGTVTTGFFHKIKLESSLRNFHCNATAMLPITHHFLGLLEQRQLKGYFAFTSSSAGVLPKPLSTIYSSSKAFVTLFATSLAGEIHHDGIDVCVIHPGPVRTRTFYEAGLANTPILEYFSVEARVIADKLFASAGRKIVVDQSVLTLGLRAMGWVCGLHLVTELFARTTHLTEDYRNYRHGTQKED